MASTLASGSETDGARARVSDVGFWAGYWKSLKPLAVEEPIDVWVHRPLAYLLARALLPTPVSPNLVTMISIVFGLVGGVSRFQRPDEIFCRLLADLRQDPARG